MTEKLRVLLAGVTLPRPVARRTPADAGLPFEPVTIVERDGTRLDAWYVPAAEPVGVVALFHGYASEKSSLLDEAEAFRGMGFSALLVDFRGCGGSTGAVTTVGYAEADDVAEAAGSARMLCPGVPLVLYGQSMGAAAVLRAVAAGATPPSALVLECPFDRLLTTVGNRFRIVGLPAFPAANLLVFWGGVQLGFDGFAHNPAEYARGVACPTLIMHGALDPLARVGDGRAVFDGLAGPKRFEVFERAGHEPCLVADRDRWLSAVTAFLARDAGMTPSR